MTKSYNATFTLLLFVGLLIARGRTSLRCDLTPAGIVAERTRKDVGRYSIEISGNPETYVPGEQYTGFNFNHLNRLISTALFNFMNTLQFQWKPQFFCSAQDDPRRLHVTISGTTDSS